MKRHTLATVALFLSLTPLLRAEDKPAASPPPKIEVCFVLDTTGSMSGLIEGAKSKIWSIANQLIKSKPSPQLKLSLVAYRDRGDEYVTKPFDLTDDIDAVYQNLHTFQAGGGGDGPESVNQALNDAISKISWSKDKSTLKVIFLVGDAPPHMDYDNDTRYPDLCKAALAKDLIINTVQCGSDNTTTPIWQEIARSAEGSFVQLGQTGDMVAVATPFDADLADLNRKLGTTLVAYDYDGRGAATIQTELYAKQSLSESAPVGATADRLYFNSATGKSVQGQGELLDALSAGTVKLGELKDEQLPEELRKLTPAQRQDRIATLQKERATLSEQITTLSQKRESYIAAERKKLASTKPSDAFDDQVTQILTTQSARKR